MIINEMTLHKDKEYIDLIKNKSMESLIIRNNHRIKQIDLYCFLRFKYGQPNGFQSFIRANDSDNFIQWHYSFKYKKVYIDILGSIRFLEFHVFANNKADFENINEDTIINELQNEISKNVKGILSIKNNIEHWDLFSNTYSRINNSLKYFYSKYSEVNPEKPIEIDKPFFTKIEADTKSFISRTK